MKYEDKPTPAPGIYEVVKDQRYRIRIKRPDPTRRTPDGKTVWQEINRYFNGDFRQALTQQVEWIAQLEQGGGSLNTKQTFRQYGLSWLKVATTRLGELARRTYGAQLVHHILPKWGDRVIDTIMPMEVEEWVLVELPETKVRGRRYKDEHGVWQPGQPTQKNLRPASVNTIFAVFRMIMSSAKKHRLLVASPAEGISGPKQPRMAQTGINSLVRPDSNEQNRENLLQVVLNDIWDNDIDYYAQVFLGVATGCRDAEARALRFIVDYIEAKRLLIFQRSQRGQSLREEDQGTKNGRSWAIEVEPRVHEVLMWQKERLMASGRPNPLGLMFPPLHESKSGFQGASTINNVIARVEKRLGLPFHITPKVKRRTVNSMCRAKGIPGDITRTVTGHLDPRSTEIYTVTPHDAALTVQRAALGNIVPFKKKGI